MNKQKRQFDAREPRFDLASPYHDGLCGDFQCEASKFKWFLDYYAGKGVYLKMLEDAKEGKEEELKEALSRAYDLLPKDRFNLSAGLRPPGFVDYIKLILKYT